VKRKDADKIIKEYRPHKGFFDLSIQPKELNKIEYAKVLGLQNYLARSNDKKKYFLELDIVGWDKLKELSSNLQGIILEYWGESIYN